MHIWGPGLLIAFTISLLIGHFAVEAFLIALRKRIERLAAARSQTNPGEVYDPEALAVDIPTSVVGTLERFVFTILIIVGVPGTATAMIAWPTLKLTHSWAVIRDAKSRTQRSLAFASLLASMMSMLFALLGGVACRLYAALAQ